MHTDDRDKTSAENRRYRHAVRLAVEVPPWKLMLHLRGLSLSKQDLLAELDVPEQTGAMTQGDVEELLTPGRRFHLQLETGDLPVAPVLLHGTLRDRHDQPTGFRLIFDLPVQNSDLDDLHQALS